MSDEYTVSELSARSPDMSESDFTAFVEDIRANGQLVPIWVRGTEVIDGRKRLAACQRLGIKPMVINLNHDHDAESVARALNVLRTHYSESQRAMYVEATANLQNGQKSVQVKLNQHAVTLEQAATSVGVSRSAVIAARRVRKEGAPEVVEAVQGGRLTLHAAKKIIAAVPKDEQPAVVERVVEASKGRARNTPVAKVLGGGDTRKDRPMFRPGNQQFAAAVQKMEVAAEIIAKFAAEAASDVHRKELLESLRHARTTITRAINTMEAAA